MKYIFTITTLIVFNSFAFSQGFDINNINKTDKNGLKQGLWVFYNIDTLYKYNIGIKPQNDTVVSNNLNTNKKDTVIYLKVSKIGFYLNNKMDSIWMVFDKPRFINCKSNSSIPENSGVLKYKAILKNDNLNGVIKEYYPNENLKLEFEIIDNEVIGKINCYHLNGKLKYSGIIQPNSAFFDGAEYNTSGTKMFDRKFNADLIKKEWINIDDILKRLKD